MSREARGLSADTLNTDLSALCKFSEEGQLNLDTLHATELI